MDTSTSSESDGQQNKKRKGVRNTHLYKHELIKRDNIKGPAHENHVGQAIPSRSTGPDCMCSRKCFDIPDDIKSGILTRINGFNTKDEQDTYLQTLVESFSVKDTSKRRSTESSKPKSYSYKYFIELDGTRKEVCKVAFLSLHGVTDKRIQRLRKLKIVNRSPHDMRGKSEGSRSNVVPPETCALVHRFIESIPVKEIHYSNNVVKRYLSSTLNKSILHTDYCVKHPSQTVSYQFFRNYFNVNFNLRPQIDVCSKCEELGVKLKNPHLNENGKRVAAAELLVHKRRASKFYSKTQEITRKCQEPGSTIMALTFDYMQNLPLPVVPVQEVFYYRQLWVYEFCVHNLKLGKAVFYSYHEGQALKGPNEVASFLNDYICTNIEDNITELHLFCDGCPGQNKNNTIIKFLLALSASRNIIIHLYFPQRGHSFNDCDRDFATVKRKIRRADRLFTHQQYVELINSSTSHEKFSVKTKTYTDIIDFKSWCKLNFKTKPLSERSYGKRVKKEDKVSFQVSTFAEFIFDPEKPGQVSCHPYIGSEMNVEIFNLSKTKGRCSSIPTIDEFPCYSSKLPINSLKMNDLQKLKQYIPAEFESFYQEILQWPTDETSPLDTEEDF